MADRRHDDRTETHVASSTRGRILVIWEGGSATYELPEPGGELVVGRAKECDISIDHASVSRQHARITSGPPVTIEDLGSSNGTVVGGARLGARQSTVLAAGDLVECGAARILVEIPGARKATPSVPPLRGESPQPAVVLDPKMVEVFRSLELVANSHLSVLILGETGTGKEVAARFVHERSPRAARPFVTLNCAAIPDHLLESELFGYEKGAFTGATVAKRGLLEAAEGGTVFLDEVAELPATAQAKLLRTLESGELWRLGALTPRTIDVRFVAATHRDLSQRVADGAFRQDLWFRLNGATVQIPPLRERTSEIATLARAFVERAAVSLGKPEPELSREALSALEAYDFPGNVRELRNAIERAVVMCTGSVIGVEHLPATVSRTRPDSAPSALPAELEALERQRIVEALERAGGNQGRAAELLGISRRTLLSRLDAYGLPRPRKGRYDRGNE